MTENMLTALAGARWITAPENGGEDRYFAFRLSAGGVSGEELRLFFVPTGAWALYENGDLLFWGAGVATESFARAEVLTIPASAEDKREWELVIASPGRDFSATRSLEPGVLFALFAGKRRLDHSEPGKTLCREDARFAGKREIVSPQLGFTLFFHAAASPLPWQKSVPKKSPCRPFESTAPRDRSEPLRKARLIKAVPCTVGGEGEIGERMQNLSVEGKGSLFLYTLDAEVTGTLFLDVTLEKEEEILLSWGEHLLPDGRVPARLGKRNFALSVRGKAGQNRLTLPFLRLGARFLELACNGKITVHTVGLFPSVYPLSKSTPAPPATALDRKIYETAARTLRLCMHDAHFEDCPWREQALYAADFRLEAKAAFLAFGETALWRESLLLFARTLRPDGLCELCPPGRVPFTIPSFSLQFVQSAAEYFSFTKDLAALQILFPAIETVLSVFLAKQEKDGGLLKTFGTAATWDFHEWSAGLNGKPRGEVPEEVRPFDATLSARFALALSSAEEMALALGKDAACYQKARQRLKDLFDPAFYLPDTESYACFAPDNGTVSALPAALALTSGLCPEARRAGLFEKLFSLPLPTLSSLPDVFEAAATDERGKIWVHKTIRRVWGAMLSNETDTFFETAEGASAFSGAGSLCHGWSASPILFYFT